MNIYIGNLPFSVTEDQVSELFAQYGQVTSVALIKDKMTGQFRGFGFVEMAIDEEANKAIQALNGKEFNRRALVVNQARPREERSDRGPRAGGGFERRGQGSGGFDRRGPRNEGPRRRDW